VAADTSRLLHTTKKPRPDVLHTEQVLSIRDLGYLPNLYRLTSIQGFSCSHPRIELGPREETYMQITGMPYARNSCPFTMQQPDFSVKAQPKCSSLLISQPFDDESVYFTTFYVHNNPVVPENR
jgi:hypothetical protein